MDEEERLNEQKKEIYNLIKKVDPVLIIYEVAKHMLGCKNCKEEICGCEHCTAALKVSIDMLEELLSETRVEIKQEYIEKLKGRVTLSNDLHTKAS